MCKFQSFTYVSVKATDKADMRRERVASAKRRLHTQRRLIFNGWVEQKEPHRKHRCDRRGRRRPRARCLRRPRVRCLRRPRAWCLEKPE